MRVQPACAAYKKIREVHSGHHLLTLHLPSPHVLQSAHMPFLANIGTNNYLQQDAFFTTTSKAGQNSTKDHGIPLSESATHKLTMLRISKVYLGYCVQL
jgi:hypothetical protein